MTKECIEGKRELQLKIDDLNRTSGRDPKMNSSRAKRVRMCALECNSIVRESATTWPLRRRPNGQMDNAARVNAFPIES